MTLDSATLAAIFAPASPTVGSIASALSKAQATLQHAAKAYKNPQTNSHYADLAGIIDVSRQPLADNALAVVQAPYHLPGEPPTVVLVTTVLHDSGEWMRSVTPVNGRRLVKGGGGETAPDDTMQATGAAITYARRYALAAMLGIGQEDDDGNHASGRTTAKEAPRRAAAAPEATRPEPEAPSEVENPFASGPQLKKLAIVLKEQGLGREDALGFFSWLVKRALTSSKEMTKDEASRALSWTSDQWSDALVDYATVLEGGPPDVSDVVVEDRPLEFDPHGNANRQPKKEAAA